MTELLDVVDENDNIIDKQHRHVVHNSQMWHRGIHVFMFDHDGNFILQKRSMKKDKSPGLFDCLSGHVKSGSTYEKTMKEELEEEMNVSSSPNPLIKLKMKYGDTDYTISKLYEITMNPNDIEIDKNEVESIKILNKEELKKMINDNPEKFTRWFLEMLKWYFGKESEIEVLGDYRK